MVLLSEASVTLEGVSFISLGNFAASLINWLMHNWIALAALVVSAIALLRGEWRDRKRDRLSALAEEEVYLGRLIEHARTTHDLLSQSSYQHPIESEAALSPEQDPWAQISITQFDLRVKETLAVLKDENTQRTRELLNGYLGKDLRGRYCNLAWLAVELSKEHFKIAAKLPSPRYNFQKHEE